MSNELQKYYTFNKPHREAADVDCSDCHEVYLPDHVDAHIAALKSQHAEEVSKLRAQVRSLNKQAERYEKALRGIYNGVCEDGEIGVEDSLTYGEVRQIAGTALSNLPGCGDTTAESDCGHWHGTTVHTNAGAVHICSNCGRSVKP